MNPDHFYGQGFIFLSQLKAMASYQISDNINKTLALKDQRIIHENEIYAFKIFHASSQDGKFQIIYSEGLAENLQSPSEAHETYHRVELYMLLPDYISIEDDKSWPVKWLNLIGQVPRKHNTWFGPGDTIPAGKPPEPIHSRLKTNHFILSEPHKLAEDLAGEKWENTFSEGQQPVKMLAVIPVYQREVNFKLKNSGTVLLHKLWKKGYSEEIDLYREVVLRKKLLGII